MADEKRQRREDERDPDTQRPQAAQASQPALGPAQERVLALQRSAGNAAVSRMLAGSEGPGLEVAPMNDLWYFNGERQLSRHPTEVDLKTDAPSGGRVVWDVVDGQDRVDLGGSGGPAHAEGANLNRVPISAKSGSEGGDDVRVRATHVDDQGTVTGVGEHAFGVRTPAGTRHVGSVTTPTAFPVGEDGSGGGSGLEEAEEEEESFESPSGAPKSLRHQGTRHDPHAVFAYETRETYEVLDDKGNPINGFDVNERWPGGVVNDDPKADWRRGPAGGTHSSGTTFFDKMQGETASHTPTPMAPQSPLGSHRVQHWDQEWYIGSTVPGKGVLVQTNLFQKYQDHAEHQNIKSPP